ncbi:MAG: hypothetical protein J1E84_01845 [Muribaculaceae bacterium]|nr:hypothetical protein [Muribaculaceae bacterium]
MKQNRQSLSGYDCWLLSYPVVVGISVMVFIYTMIYAPGIAGLYGKYDIPYVLKQPDSYSYIDASYSIFEGNIDIARTPVYPLILGIMRLVAGPVYMFPLVALFQFGLFLLSARYLRLISLKFLGSRRAAFWVTGLYLVIPSFSTYCVIITTDSLAVSGLIFLTWFMVRNLPDKPKPRDMICTGVSMLTLILLRPIFVYLILVYIVYYAIYFMQNRVGCKRIDLIVCTAVLVAVSAGLFAYKSMVNSVYGIKSITIITAVNNYALARESVGIHPELAKDRELRDLLEVVDTAKTENEWKDFEILGKYVNKYPNRFEAYINDLIWVSPFTIAKKIYHRFLYEVPKYNVFVNPTVVYEYSYPVMYPFDLFTTVCPGFYFYWIVVLSYLAICVRNVCKARNVPIYSLLFLLLSLGLVLTAVIGAQSDYSRLTLPVAPIFLLISVKLFSLLKIKDHNEIS